MNTIIIEKIKKLLALSKSSNESEAKSALLKVQELLVKYKLTIKDIEENKSNITYYQTDISFTKAKWKVALGKVIAENFGCIPCIKTENRTNYIVFFGKEEDINICNLTFIYAIDSIQSVVKMLKNKYIRNKLSTKNLENDYAIGFIYGLKIAFDKKIETNSEFALVLKQDKEVLEEYKKLNIKEEYNNKTSVQEHELAYSKGVEDGKNFEMSKRISDKKDVEISSLK